MKKIFFGLFILLLMPLVFASLDTEQVSNEIVAREVIGRELLTADLIRQSPELSPDTIIDARENKASVKVSDLDLSINKFHADSGEEVTLYVGSSDTVSDLCFYFPVELDSIVMEEITISDGNDYKSDISDYEVRAGNSICYNTNFNSGEINYKPKYKGTDTIKYNISLNGLILDPYLIGDTLGTAQLSNTRNVLSLKFDGNSSAEPSYIYNSIPVSGLRYNETAQSASYVDQTYYFGVSGAINPSYFLDGSYSTYSTCWYQGAFSETMGCSDYSMNYLLASTDTGATWQVRTGSGGTNLPGSYTSNVGYNNLSIPDTCISYAKNTNNNVLQLRTLSSMPYVYSNAQVNIEFQCYGYTSTWQTLSTATVYASADDHNYGRAELWLYEEGLYITNSSNYTAYTIVTPKTQYYNVNGLVWSNSFGFWGNDSVNALKNDVNTSQTAVNNGTTFVDTGASFDGVNDYIRYNISNLNNLTGTIYIKVKVLNNSVIPYQRILSSEQIVAQTGIILFYDRGNNKIVFGMYNTTTSYLCSSNIPLVDFNNYYNYAITWNTTKCILTNLNTNTTSISNKINGSVLLNNITLGSNNFQRTPIAEFFNGTIDNIKIYNRSLSAEEVYILYKGGNFTTNINGEANKSIYLNGNEVIRVQNITLNNTIAYSTSIFINDSIPNNNNYIWDNGNYGYLRNNLLANYENSIVINNLNNYARNIITTNNGTNYKSYLDSVYTNGSTTSIVYSKFPSFFLGGYSSASTNLPSIGLYVGKLDEFNVYNYVLSQDEIRTLSGGYNSSITLYLIDQTTGSYVNGTSKVNIFYQNGSLLTTQYVVTPSLFYNGLAIGNYSIVVTNPSYNSGSTGVSINSANSNYNINLLMSQTAVQRFIYVTDYQNNYLQNAYVSVTTSIDGVVQNVFSGYTDSSGKVSLFLDPTLTYTATVTYSNYEPKVYVYVPTDTFVTIRTGIKYVPIVVEPYGKIDVSLDNNTGGILYQNTSYTFYIRAIATGTNTLDYFGVTVNNSGVITTQNKTTSTGGTSSVTITTDTNSTAFFPINVNYYYKVHGESSERGFSKNFFAYPIGASNFTLINVFSQFKSDLNLDDTSFKFISGILVTFITIAIIGSIAYATGVVSIDILIFLALILQSGWCAIGFFDWFIWSMMAVPYFIYMLVKGLR